MDPWEYFTYDSLGNLTSTQDETGTFGNVFDHLNRIVTKTTKAGVVYYTYDLSGLQTAVVGPDGTGTYYAYNAASQMSPATAFDSGGQRPANYKYDASCLVTQRALDAGDTSNSVLTYYSYDNAGRLHSLNNVDQNFTTLSFFYYTRNENGAPTYIARDNSLTQYYAYDPLDRMTREIWRGSGTTVLYGFYYDFDAASNRYFKFDMVANLRTYYGYDGRNLLQTEVTS